MPVWGRHRQGQAKWKAAGRQKKAGDPNPIHNQNQPALKGENRIDRPGAAKQIARTQPHSE